MGEGTVNSNIIHTLVFENQLWKAYMTTSDYKLDGGSVYKF